LLEELRQDDVFDQNGFEVQQVSMKQRLEEVQQEKKKQAAELLATESSDAQKALARKKVLQDGGEAAQLLQSKESQDAKKRMAEAYSGRDAVVTGFWAKDRPHEERIDPDTMRIYTFKTFEKRFPFTHSWDVEVKWKKLPLAPTKVHKVARKQSPKSADSAVLMDTQSGTMLVNEKMQELVWTRDSNGYYHMGEEIPTPEEIFAISHPMEAELRKEADKRAFTKQMSGLYPEHGTHLEHIKNKLKSSKRTDREEATQRLEHMLIEMQDTLKVKPELTGKAMISVRGADGYLCSFNANIGRVNGRMVKNRIENATGIPWESQKLKINGEDIKDTELLNEHIGAGRSGWIDVLTKGWEVTRQALIKRGKIQLPTVHRKHDPNEKPFDPTKKQPAKMEKALPKPVAVIDKSERDIEAEHPDDGTDPNMDSPDQPQVNIFEPAKVMVQENTALVADSKKLAENVDKDKAAILETMANKQEQQKLEKKATAPEHHAVVTRRVVYTKDDDGKWHAEKVHPHKAQKQADVDEGIPAEDRISEVTDEDVALLEMEAQPKQRVRHAGFSMSAADSRAKTKTDDKHDGSLEARQSLDDFKKNEKHALSELQKWQNAQKKIEEAREKKADEAKAAAAAEKASTSQVKKASLVEDPKAQDDATTEVF